MSKKADERDNGLLKRKKYLEFRKSLPGCSLNSADFRSGSARDRMLEVTDTKHAPWYIVRSDEKKRARLNCISHLLSTIPYGKVPREKVELPKCK
jgi:hypothetical protein